MDLKSRQNSLLTIKDQQKTPMSTGVFVGYKGKYALCTSSKCIPYIDPITKQKIMLCKCSVYNGKAVGSQPNASYKPYKCNGNTYVYSLYSGINQSQLTKQTCTSGTWGNCLNKICVVDKNNPKKAYCSCSPKTKQPWVTGQNISNTKPCACNNLSGSLNAGYVAINKFYNNYISKSA